MRLTLRANAQGVPIGSGRPPKWYLRGRPRSYRIG